MPALQKLRVLIFSVLPRDSCPGICVSIKEQTIGLCENSFTARVRYRVAQQMGYEISFTAINCYTGAQRVPIAFRYWMNWIIKPNDYL